MGQDAIPFAAFMRGGQQLESWQADPATGISARSHPAYERADVRHDEWRQIIDDDFQQYYDIKSLCGNDIRLIYQREP